MEEAHRGREGLSGGSSPLGIGLLSLAGGPSLDGLSWTLFFISTFAHGAYPRVGDDHFVSESFFRLSLFPSPSLSIVIIARLHGTVKYCYACSTGRLTLHKEVIPYIHRYCV